MVYLMDFTQFLKQASFFGKGTLITLELTMISMVIGTFLGMIVALGRISKNKFIDKSTWFMFGSLEVHLYYYKL